MGLRCVIVEDQTMFLQMLHNMILTLPDLEIVATARNVEEGRQACRTYLPDVLLLDLALPDGNGFSVAETLLQLKADARIIIVSGQAESFVFAPGMKQHIHAVLDKTQAFDDLLSELKTLLPRARGGSTSVRAKNIARLLSPREYEIFQCMGRGLMSKEIGEQLGISPQTVQVHRRKIAAKLGTSGPELGQQAIRYYHTNLGTRS